MSAIPLGGASARERSPSEKKLPPPALAYFILMTAAALAVTAPFLADLDRHTGGWLEFAVLGTSVALAQFFVVRTPGNRSYHTTGVFLIAAVLLVPPPLLALIPLIQHVPEWLRSRGTWYVQSFNVLVFTIATMAAWGGSHLVLEADGLLGDELRFALAGTVASLVLVTLNSALLAPMIRWVHGHPMRDLFSYQTLSTELVFASLGVALAAFWTVNPWLVPFAIAPLLLLHRALSVPQLQQEARVDPKTGLFNARHFAAALTDELTRAQRFDRPLSLVMVDLDLLREINNTYGHLAGDAVLKGIADVFRAELRHFDVPARFGGEEFSILLPETPPEQALEIAERIRRSVAARTFDVETSSEPIRATVSIGVAGYPKDAGDPNGLIHQADLAVYRAKLQGRNRVLGASSEPLLLPADRRDPLVSVPVDGAPDEPSVPRGAEALPLADARHTAHTTSGPRFLQLSHNLALLVGLVSTLGVAAGVLGLFFGTSTDLIGLLAVVALVGVGEALSLELDDGSISVSAVGMLAGAAMFGPRAALVLAVTTAVVQWSTLRSGLHHVLFNVGALTLSSLTASAVFTFGFPGGLGELITVGAGLAAGAAYFAVNTGLVSLALALEGRERWWRVWHERFLWLAPHYVVYGFIGGVIAIGYHAAGLYALAVFAVPLLLMRKTQEAYLSHTRRSAQKLRQAAETIHTQNVSLEQANRLLKERSTAAMESLSATVDARDAYTAGHSRRVQQLALAIGRELGLSQVELDLLGHAALFHDIGKLAIPDSILLKPASLTDGEWALMQRHADEGARIIDRLGFLGDAVPAIRHHHERFDGTGYPDGLRGEEIPLGARIIHVADALDSMLTTRIYRAARPLEESLEELRSAAGTQFCPRCVTALERILPLTTVEQDAVGRRRALAV
jgi:diguanylate cyclase (GGDEF)-like protein/putative nucleotidyltransferase with HDIG domain